MSRINAVLVLGTRPQFIKSSPLIHELLSHRRRFQLALVHTGQHYDPEMSKDFFAELAIPRPKANLRVGSGTHAYQTATIMLGLQTILMRFEPDVVIVPGDTNTTLAAALAATKTGYRVAHLEAGLRSGDSSMPEEINRRLTDHCSSLLFAPTRNAFSNLVKEGIASRAWLTGDTTVDVLQYVTPIVRQREEAVLRRFQVSRRSYVLVTLHRPTNVDDPKRLSEIIRNLQRVEGNKVIFPIHPRTRQRLRNLRIGTSGVPSCISLLPPQGYIVTLALLKNARCLLTDSGGMQKEAFLLHTPCITLRSTTEWPETLRTHANRLIQDPAMIPGFIAKTQPLNVRRFTNPFGDGKAAQRIRRILDEHVDP